MEHNFEANFFTLLELLDPASRLEVEAVCTKISFPPNHFIYEQGAPANAVYGEVWDIGYLGDFSVFLVRLDDGRIVRAAQANVSRLVDRPITFGDMVWLTWSRDAGLVLTR